LETKAIHYDLAKLPCRKLDGVGTRLAELLAGYGLNTVQDLLFHLPFRYQDRTRITPIGQIRSGDHVMIEGAVELAEVSRTRRSSLLVRLWDGTGYLTLRFFHFNASQQRMFKRGVLLRCFGEARGWAGQFEMIHPEYQQVTPNKPAQPQDCLTPIYSTTEGITQRLLRQLTDQALALLEEGQLPEYLPESILSAIQLPNLVEALRYVHRPPPDAPVNLLLQGVHPAQQRLAFEELLAHHLSLRRLRQNLQENIAPALPGVQQLTTALLNSLPFALTNAQQRVLQEVSHDLTQTKPMLRLVQGDVSSGKTIVAALAILQAVENNYQGVLMAPTELLAEQHYQNFRKWLEPLGITMAWLAGKLKGKARNEMLELIASGEAKVIVGTHALFQADVKFARLGLVVIDEQHRFGVHQRLALREKGFIEGAYPHQLIMTATPIPRTLAMTAYADLDYSIIDELPPGRTPVQTVVISDQRRHEVIARVQEACREKRQVYWVCPLIEDSEVLQCQAAETTAGQLTQYLPEFKIGLVHGRMKSAEKEMVMAAFKAGELDLLVATTVIEVGVDVPNASLMVIENAERLGLAQLHQLRGRVGRGATASFCVLIYQHDRLSQLAKERLAIMRKTTDGFAIAKRDLELRGPGEVLGTKQSGLMQLRVADLMRDSHLLPKVQQAAEIILEKFPERMEKLVQRWVANREKYSDA
jgi:ATP-dependent DNA helicase RecG